MIRMEPNNWSHWNKRSEKYPETKDKINTPCIPADY